MPLWKYSEALLNAVTANTVGTPFNVDGASGLKVYLKSASVSTGADIVVYEKSPEGDWHEVHRESVSTNGNQDPIYLPGPFDDVRIDVENHTDGTYTASAQAL
ncbi:MAG: hypothetical protein VW338_03500 [Rhodospirillaceae bacterium]